MSFGLFRVSEYNKKIIIKNPVKSIANGLRIKNKYRSIVCRIKTLYSYFSENLEEQSKLWVSV